MPAESLSFKNVGGWMEGRQLTLELFERLDEAVRVPEEMSVTELLKQLDVTLDGVSVSEQMIVAGDALTKIVAAFSERAEMLLLDWEDRCRGPLVDGNWLEGLVGRSPTFELAAYESAEVQLPSPPKQYKPSSAKRIRYLSKAEALAELEEPQTVEEVVRQTYRENIGQVEQELLIVLEDSKKRASLLALTAEVESGNVLLILLVVLLSNKMQLCVAPGRFYVGFGDLHVEIG